MAGTTGSHAPLHRTLQQRDEWGPSEIDPSPKTSERILVSMVKDAFKTETHDVRADKVIAAIRNGRWKKSVEEIRRADDKDLASKLKTCLPGVLFSGKFSERKNNALVQHSGLLCADLDKPELDKAGKDLPSVRAKLLESPHLWALSKSPGGGGLKAVFRVPADVAKHRGSFRAVEQHVKALTGVQIDEACKDPARLCFVSDDPAAYHNQDATELQPLHEPEKPKCISNGELQPDLPLRERIASGLLGSLEWSEEKGGYFCQCPGEAYHTNGTGSKHTILYLDGAAATIKCQHNSCLTVVDTYNYRLRSEIGKAEREINRADASKAETPKEANEAKRSPKNGSELQGSAVICPAY